MSAAACSTRWARFCCCAVTTVGALRMIRSDMIANNLEFIVQPTLALRLTARGRIEIFPRDETLPFFNGQNLVHTPVSQLINSPAGPAHFDQIDLRPLLQAKVQPQIALRDVAAAAAYFVALREIAGHNLNARDE